MHVSELLDGGGLLSGGELVLTTGLELENRRESPRRLSAPWRPVIPVSFPTARISHLATDVTSAWIWRRVMGVGANTIVLPDGTALRSHTLQPTRAALPS